MRCPRISGGTPYGATTMAGNDGKRLPTENEKKIARFQGQHVARIAVQAGQGRMIAARSCRDARLMRPVC